MLLSFSAIIQESAGKMSNFKDYLYENIISNTTLGIAAF